MVTMIDKARECLYIAKLCHLFGYNENSEYWVDKAADYLAASCISWEKTEMKIACKCATPKMIAIGNAIICDTCKQSIAHWCVTTPLPGFAARKYELTIDTQPSTC